MRINEIVKLEGKALHEAIHAENDTGVKTEDLVKMVEAHRKDEWKTFETGEDFNKYLDSLMEAANASEV